jgi:hypothetical protein
LTRLACLGSGFRVYASTSLQILGRFPFLQLLHTLSAGRRQIIQHRFEHVRFGREFSEELVELEFGVGTGAVFRIG